MNATAQKGAGHPRSPALSAEVVLEDWRVWETQTTGQMAAWHPGQGQPQVDGNFGRVRKYALGLATDGVPMGCAYTESR